MRTHSLFLATLPALAVLALTGEARADLGRDPLAGQPAIRHRIEMRKLRFEITPEFLISLNQPYLIGVGGGANVQFHITDWLGIGASFHYTANATAPLESSIQNALPTTYPDPSTPAGALRQPDQTQFRSHLIGANMLGALYAALTPIGGKFALFNSIFANYDFYGMGGIGFANLTNPEGCTVSASNCQPPLPAANCTTNPNQAGCDPNTLSPNVFTGLRFAGLLGIGMHIYFNDWIGLQLEVRDYLYKANPGGLSVTPTSPPSLSGGDEYVTSNLYFGLGLTFMLPPTASISR